MPGLVVRMTTVRRIMATIRCPTVVRDGVQIIATGSDIIGGVVTHVEPLQWKINGYAELTSKPLRQ